MNSAFNSFLGLYWHSSHHLLGQPYSCKYSTACCAEDFFCFVLLLHICIIVVIVAPAAAISLLLQSFPISAYQFSLSFSSERTYRVLCLSIFFIYFWCFFCIFNFVFVFCFPCDPCFLLSWLAYKWNIENRKKCSFLMVS